MSKVHMELDREVVVRVPDRMPMRGASKDDQRFDRSRQDEFAGHSDDEAERTHRRLRRKSRKRQA